MEDYLLSYCEVFVQGSVFSILIEHLIFGKFGVFVLSFPFIPIDRLLTLYLVPKLKDLYLKIQHQPMTLLTKARSFIVPAITTPKVICSTIGPEMNGITKQRTTA